MLRMLRCSVTFAILAASLTTCDRDRGRAAPLTHRAYVWQREWTPAVKAAVGESKSKLAGQVVLGAEITWRASTARPVRATIDWRSLGSTCSLALRVAPWPGPFDDASAKPVVDEALHLLSEAKAHAVACTELQLDFDCAQKKLAGYERWVRAVRAAIHPARLVITTLPVWLAEPEFKSLIAAADGYVLQVHSVMPTKNSDRTAICDPERARKCVAQAGALGRDFEVALPTYSALVGFDAAGKLLGYHFEGPAPDWPANAKVMQFRSQPEEMAALVREWQTKRPAHLRGVLWYRLPISTDRQNWTLPQLYAVIEGRLLRHDLAAVCENKNPVDIIVINRGEADEVVQAVRVSWNAAQLVASDALPGWRIEPGTQSVTFHPGVATDGGGRRAFAIPGLSPGERRSIGWLRFDKPAFVHVEIVH